MICSEIEPASAVSSCGGLVITAMTVRTTIPTTITPITEIPLIRFLQ